MVTTGACTCSVESEKASQQHAVAAADVVYEASNDSRSGVARSVVVYSGFASLGAAAVYCAMRFRTNPMGFRV